MRRLISVITAVLLVISTYGLSIAVPAAHATAGWCQDDPIVQINGVTVHVIVSMWTVGIGHVPGNVPVAIVVPAADLASSSVISIYAPHFGSETVGFFTADQSTRIAAYLGVPASEIHLHGDHDSDSRVTVFSIIRSSDDFGTRLFTSQSDHITIRRSNQLMSVDFELAGR